MTFIDVAQREIVVREFCEDPCRVQTRLGATLRRTRVRRRLEPICLRLSSRWVGGSRFLREQSPARSPPAGKHYEASSDRHFFLLSGSMAISRCLACHSWSGNFPC